MAKWLILPRLTLKKYPLFQLSRRKHASHVSTPLDYLLAGFKLEGDRYRNWKMSCLRCGLQCLCWCTRWFSAHYKYSKGIRKMNITIMG